MIITKELEIDMGHRIPNHKSKCKNLHGHHYKIEVGIEGEVMTTKGESDEGMIIDFNDIKEALMILDKKFDHGFMMYDKDPLVKIFKSLPNQKIIFVDFIPTAENISRYFFKLLKPELEKRKVKIKYLKLWETPTSTVKYEN